MQKFTKNQICRIFSRLSEIDFTENLSSRKFAKFPHCALQKINFNFRPCILIFDSLQTGSRARVAATLREYLKCEYKAKMNQDRDFDKDTMKGCCPKVPQQPNFSDCGLFMLQYVESLFTSPIKDFSLPIKSLHKWFSKEVMRTKRAKIAEIIRNLAEEQHKNKIQFPSLVFTPDSGSGYTDDEDDDLLNSATSKITSKLKPKFLMKANSSGQSPSSGTRVICLTSAKSALSSLTPTKASSAASNASSSVSGSLMIQKKRGKMELFKLQKTPVKSTANASATSTTTPTPTSSTTSATTPKLPIPTASSSSRPNSPSFKSVNVLIPKLTKGGGGEKVVRKEVMVENEAESAAAANSEKSKGASSNGPTSETPAGSNPAEKGAAKSTLVNYSDSSSSGGSSKPEEEDDPCPFDMEVDEDGAPKLEENPLPKMGLSKSSGGPTPQAVKKRSASRDQDTSSENVVVEPKKPKLTLDEALEGKKSPTVAPSVNNSENNKSA